MNLKDYGAVPDGHTLCTQAFENALAALSAQGGGHLEVPAGTWLTGPIRLRSNIDLHLAKGSLVQFSGKKSLYPLVIIKTEHDQKVLTTPPISGKDLRNISITGPGTLDGGGDAWRPVKKAKVTPERWKSFLSRGGVLDEKQGTWYPDQGSRNGPAFLKEIERNHPADAAAYEPCHRYLRPKMVELTRCEKVLLQEFRITNSPNWTIHPDRCTDVTVRGVVVDNPDWAQNSDAIDLESCRGALIEGMWINTGDDGICIKSGKDEEGRRIGIPSEHVLVKDCTVHQAHGGFVIGSEMSGGVRDFLVMNCTFEGTQVGLRFKTAATRGGVVEGIRIRGIRMRNILNQAICFQSNYGTGGGSKAARSSDPASGEVSAGTEEHLPIFRDFRIEDVTCDGAARAAVIDGFPQSPVQNIVLRHATIRSDEGAQLSNVRNVVFENVRIQPKSGPAVMTGENVVDCRLGVLP
jgi:DNA sulfur modification protein DndE